MNFAMYHYMFLFQSEEIRYSQIVKWPNETNVIFSSQQNIWSTLHRIFWHTDFLKSFNILLFWWHGNFFLSKQLKTNHFNRYMSFLRIQNQHWLWWEFCFQNPYYEKNGSNQANVIKKIESTKWYLKKFN